MNRLTILTGIIILACSVSQSAAADQPPWRKIEIKPQILRGEGDDPGYGLSLNFDRLLEAYSIEEDWGTADFVLHLNYAEKRKDEIAPTLARVRIQPSFFKEGWSSLLDFQAAYEAGNHFHHQEINAGLWGGLTRSIFPPHSIGPTTISLTANAGYDLACLLKSDRREAGSQDEQTDYGRFSLQAQADIWLPFLRFRNDEWLFSAEFHQYWQHQLTSTLTDEEEGGFDYVRLTLAYEFERPIWEFWRAVYVQFTDGRLPTQSESNSLFIVGLKFIGR